MAKRILIPLDRSSASEAVLPLIGDAARGAGATVRLLHIAPVPDAVEREYGRGAADSDRVMERATADGESYLEGAGASLQGVPVERVVRFGDPAREILVEAEAWGADLIAVTATPASPFRRLVRQPGHPDHGNTGFEDRGRSGGERRLRLHSQARQRRLRREPRRGGAEGRLAKAAQLRPVRRRSRRGR